MRRVAIAGLVAICAFYAVCTWTGVDFGGHWDEIPWLIRPAATAIRNGTVLSTRYVYPSLIHDVILISAVPHLSKGREEAARTVESKPFLLRMRRVIGGFSALTIVWVFLIVLVARASPLEALLAAAIAAGSWELQYHSRWLTTDPVVAHFGALTLLLAVAGYRRQSPWLLRASAIAAGLGCSAKYPAGLLLLIVLVACWLSAARWRRMAEAVVLFAVAFVATTPGAVFATRLLVHDVLYAQRAYASGWGIYTVSAPGEHTRLLAEYLALVQLSHVPLIAAFLAIAALGGAIVVAREDRRLAAIVLAFPLVYLAYFATQRVMVVRNVLVMVPFLAVLGAIGIGTMLRHVRTPALKSIVVVAIAAMLVINLAWLWIAARSIRQPPRVYLAQLTEFLDNHAERRFALSPGVAAALEGFDGRARAVLDPRMPGVDAMVFFATESPMTPIVANHHDSVERWFGAHEVNFNYYPSWITADRILVVAPEKVRWMSR